MVSFDNTAVAFESKSNKDLKRAHLLFSLIGKNWLVATGKRATNFVFSIGLPVKGIIKATIFRQFVGGETIEECERTIAALARYNIGTILDYSVEGLHDESGFAASEAEILRTIRKSAADPRIPFSVFKVSGLAREQVLEKVSSGATLTESETSEWQATSGRVDRLCKAAFEAGKPVLIDAEDSWIQDAIDQLALDMMRKYNREKAIVYNTVQFYRHDRLAYLKAFYETAEKEQFFAGIKAVRGAYMEKERARAAEKNYSDPIQPDKFSTDRDFDAG